MPSTAGYRDDGGGWMTPVGGVAPAVKRRPELSRFSAAERWVHRLTAGLMLICIGTAAILYNGSLSLAVGHRRQVELIHVYCGFALPAPMILGLVSLAYRSDLRRLNRFTAADWRWLRPGRRRPEDRVGKFNAGQKVNSWLSSGSILVLVLSGCVMYFVGLSPLSWRTGATFVHDWFALAVGLLVAGHIVRALKDPEARKGMRTGSVSAHWAREEHPAWAAELEHDQSISDPDGRSAD
jgi:formate dehydrogenase subunit gamma